MKDKLDLKPLISTRNFLAEIIQNAKNDYEKAGAIQAFEVSFELAKNVMRKVLLLRAQETPITPKEIFRLATLENLIDNAELDSLITKGTARKFSDLDLCYQDNLSDALVFQIEEEFKESDLPFLVELVSWKRMSPQFQGLIKKDLVEIN
nr:6559_t:CDS:2 [Entrophospora candida]